MQFVLAGGVLLNQPRFGGRVAALLRKSWPNSVVAPLKRESVWGAVELAKRQFQKGGARVRARPDSSVSPKHPSAQLARSRSGGQYFPSLDSLQRSPTEQRNSRSLNLDRLPVAEAIMLMLSEDAKIPAAILGQRKKIEQAIRLIARSFRKGGRLFYVGAGTSGRLGVLDASECPPTFRVSPDQVQGIIAGGNRALWESVEGAEDDLLVEDGERTDHDDPDGHRDEQIAPVHGEDITDQEGSQVLAPSRPGGLQEDAQAEGPGQGDAGGG